MNQADLRNMREKESFPHSFYGLNVDREKENTLGQKEKALVKDQWFPAIPSLVHFIAYVALCLFNRPQPKGLLIKFFKTHYNILIYTLCAKIIAAVYLRTEFVFNGCFF